MTGDRNKSFSKMIDEVYFDLNSKRDSEAKEMEELDRTQVELKTVIREKVLPQLEQMAATVLGKRNAKITGCGAIGLSECSVAKFTLKTNIPSDEEREQNLTFTVEGDHIAVATTTDADIEPRFLDRETADSQAVENLVAAFYRSCFQSASANR
ncbi:hypothetical protein SAMN06265222_1302 [Neorhodopirellula lusitana]|uniref:Uncharacterized protein n=1 Tax=Neorhodopirellula lusitana TaxID=445327 RepID=A0ABY1QS17_9BACT|nr:hypothetical protein [Neorhodopirellula lusitana]SMP79213.1 hypothetical protein SAMN06265222_1302 [Neorhodopirellula lusitana]